MVFDNCQIDVFFHMRSHYSRLRSVQSVVDCSPPKTLKRTSHSESSFQNVQMANLPKHCYGTKNKHSCSYGILTDLVTPEGHNITSKTKGLPPRPKTRRNQEDLPHCTLGKHSRSSGSKSSKHPLTCIGYLHRTPKSRKKDVNLKNITPRTSDEFSCPSAKSSQPNTARSIRRDKTPPSSKSQKSCPLVHSEGENAQTECTTPKKIFLCNANPSLEDHEYLQFLLRITEDIIKNDLYSNEEMKKVFTSHIKANKDRLDLNRMLLRIHELMKELNIPLDGIDAGENPSPSWTDIETTMKGLLSLEKEEDSSKPDGEKEPPPKQKCICFDLRATHPLVALITNPKEENLENADKEKYTPTIAFKAPSLDRLTEHTEPLSSLATCKISTSFSNFGDVDILPGFESLETPKVSTGVLCEILRKQKSAKIISRTICDCHSVKKISKSLHKFECPEAPKVLAKVLCELYRKQKFVNSISETVCHCHSIKKKPKRRKRKLKKRKKTVHTKVKKNEKGADNKTQIEKENQQEKTTSPEQTEKPITISIQEPNIQSIEDDSYQRNLSNDYVLIKVPIHLLKSFLGDNSETLMGKQLQPNTVISSKVSPHVNDTNVIDVMTSKENTNNITDNDENKTANEEMNKDTEREEDEEIETILHDSNTEENVSKDIENKYIADDTSKDENKNDNEKMSSSEDLANIDKFQEIRNILLELTNFPISSFTSLENEREQAFHHYDSDECGRSNTSTGAENKKYSCKPTCPNKSICEKLSSIPTASHNSQAFYNFDSIHGCGPSNTSTGAENKYSCKPTCPNKSICEKLTNIPTETPQLQEIEMKQFGDEYDYTPQKEENPKNVYLTPEVMEEFLTTREIQTEDLPHNPTIVGAVLISKDKVTDTDQIDSEIELNQSGPDEPMASITKKPDTKLESPAQETAIPLPKKFNVLLTPKPSDPVDEPHNIIPEDPPGMSSILTNATFGTLKSTATVEPNKTFQEIEENIISKPMSRLFLHGTHDTSNDDSKEGLHNRKVSILKNPIVQVPVENIFNENDDSKKIGESIIRAVESVKDRQMARDPFLDKVLHGIESSRETRAPEKTINSDVSEFLAMPGPSALKNTGRGAYYPSDDIDDSEYDEKPPDSNSAGQKDMDTETERKSGFTTTSSSGASDHSINMAEQPELRGTPSQINQINRVNAKLEQLRQSRDKDEAEITETFNKLVESLKAQQETEEQALVKNDEAEKKPTSSNRKRSFKCCGFCKRKKAPAHIPFNEPAQQAFSEEDYKAKSDAFEMALASLGQKPKNMESEFQKKKISRQSDDDIMRKMDEYFGPSPIVHSGNRLSLVRIADEKENDLKVLNDDFEDISTKISFDKMKKKG